MRIERQQEARKPADTTFVLGGLALSALLAARLVPFHLLPPFCPLRVATGLPCPACGMTRAFVRVAHGELSGALQVSPLGTLLAFGALLGGLWLLLRLSVLKRGYEVRLSEGEKSWGARILLGLAALNWGYLLLSGAATR